jgi:hypothetical protein
MTPARLRSVLGGGLERIDEETRRLNPRFLLGGSWRCWRACVPPRNRVTRGPALIRIGRRMRGPLQNCGFGVDLLRYRNILRLERTHFSGKLSLLYWWNWRDRLDRDLIQAHWPVVRGLSDACENRFF